MVDVRTTPYSIIRCVEMCECAEHNETQEYIRSIVIFGRTFPLDATCVASENPKMEFIECNLKWTKTNVPAVCRLLCMPKCQLIEGNPIKDLVQAISGLGSEDLFEADQANVLPVPPSTA